MTIMVTGLFKMKNWTETEIEEALVEIGNLTGSNRAAELIVNNPSGFGRVLVIFSYSNGASEECTSDTIGGAVEEALEKASAA